MSGRRGLIRRSVADACVLHSFYDGGKRERDMLWRAYLRLIKHVNSIFKVSA